MGKGAGCTWNYTLWPRARCLVAHYVIWQIPRADPAVWFGAFGAHSVPRCQIQAYRHKDVVPRYDYYPLGGGSTNPHLYCCCFFPSWEPNIRFYLRGIYAKRLITRREKVEFPSSVFPSAATTLLHLAARNLDPRSSLKHCFQAPVAPWEPSKPMETTWTTVGDAAVTRERAQRAAAAPAAAPSSDSKIVRDRLAANLSVAKRTAAQAGLQAGGR
jgi:hypothetical protein